MALPFLMQEDQLCWVELTSAFLASSHHTTSHGSLVHCRSGPSGRPMSGGSGFFTIFCPAPWTSCQPVIGTTSVGFPRQCISCYRWRSAHHCLAGQVSLILYIHESSLWEYKITDILHFHFERHLHEELYFLCRYYFSLYLFKAVYLWKMKFSLRGNVNFMLRL